MKVSPLTAALPRLAPEMEWAWSSRLALPSPHRHLPCPSPSSHGYMGPQLTYGFPPVCPAAVLTPHGGSWSVFLVGAWWRADVAFSVSCWGGDLHGGDKAVVATLGLSLRLKDVMRSLASPHVVPGQGQKGGMARDLCCPYSTVVLIPPHLPLLPARAPVV
uniref:Limb bud and heart development homolog n=1 Tax=Pan troglodytes TaxID=9598 RepID=K7DFY3_PANTR